MSDARARAPGEKLQRKNLIQYNRGTLTVLDRKGLEKISCECYVAARAFRRLLQ
jgi:hypothetical protein